MGLQAVLLLLLVTQDAAGPKYLMPFAYKQLAAPQHAHRPGAAQEVNAPCWSSQLPMSCAAWAHLARPEVHHRQSPSSADAEQAVLLLVQCEVGHKVCVSLQGCYGVALPGIPQLQQPIIIACKAEAACACGPGCWS